MRKRILILANHQKVLNILAFALGREGYRIIKAVDGQAGIQLAEEQAPDLIVLNLELSVNGAASAMGNLDVCRSLREVGVDTPILVFTRTDNEWAELVDAGADDDIRMPFAMRDLLSKIKVNTWHLEDADSASQIQTFGRIAIDPEQVKVFKDGSALDLTQREFDLIAFLAKEPGRVYTREDLMHHVWEYAGFVGDVRAVDVTIRRLRKKIEDDPAKPIIIITKRGKGYFLASEQ